MKNIDENLLANFQQLMDAIWNEDLPGIKNGFSLALPDLNH